MGLKEEWLAKLEAAGPVELDEYAEIYEMLHMELSKKNFEIVQLKRKLDDQQRNIKEYQSRERT